MLRPQRRLAVRLVAVCGLAIVFVCVARLDRPVVGLMTARSLVGGSVGAKIGRRLPETLLRVLVVVAGTVTSINMLLR